MSVSTDISAVERRLAAAGITLADWLREQDIPYRTWHRWRDGTTQPGADDWSALMDLADAQLPRIEPNITEEDKW
jgi:argininosuccinate lyase